MDENELFHEISVQTNVNIELLKDLIHDEKLLTLIKVGNSVDAILHIRRIQPRVELMEAKMIIKAFSAALK